MYGSNEIDSVMQVGRDVPRWLTAESPSPGRRDLADIGLADLLGNIRLNRADFLIATDLRGRIRLISPNVESLLNRSAAELQGAPVHGLFEEGPGPSSDIVGRLTDNGELENVEMLLRRRNGDSLHVNVSASVITARDGVKAGAVFLLRDITEKRKLEKQLRHAQKMEAIGTLAGGIAHNFNNLLTGIQGCVSLMLFDVPPGHPYHETLKSIEHHIQSGADLTKKLLGFAKGGKYEVKPTDMNDLIRKNVRFFGRTHREIKMHGRYSDPLWTAEVDAGQIEHVLLNLFINAWQAMPEGGDIFIFTENVVLDEPFLKAYPPAQPGAYIKIAVKDNGVGMDEATAHRDFEPFFTTKEKSQGTGLGLASAYGIVKGHGGVIKVHSRVGKGTTVTIYLPASDRAVLPEIKPQKDMMKRGSETLLIIDDEESIARVTAELLERIGYRVLTAGSA
jgi:PAS domain S-box-containing protein